MSDINIPDLLRKEMDRREEARMASAAQIIEQAIQAALPVATDALEGRSPQAPAANTSNGVAPAAAPSADTSVPGPPPQPQASSTPSTGSDQSTNNAHSDALVALAAQELGRFRPGSDEQLAAIEEKSRQLSTLTRRDEQELMQELASQLAQQQPQAQPDSTGSDQSEGFSLRSIFRPDNR